MEIVKDFLESIAVPPRVWDPHHPQKIERMFLKDIYGMFLVWYDRKGYMDKQPFKNEEDFKFILQNVLSDFGIDWETVPCRSAYNRSQAEFKYFLKKFRLNLEGRDILVRFQKFQLEKTSAIAG
jgi:hypothetical protein